MRSKYFFAFILLFCFLNNSHAQGFLKAQGKIIVNGEGEKFILRGMGIGGWMLQEGYMFKLSHLGQQYKIKEKIKELVGEEKTKQFLPGMVVESYHQNRYRFNGRMGI
jgi:endoglucanase